MKTLPPEPAALFFSSELELEVDAPGDCSCGGGDSFRPTLEAGPGFLLGGMISNTHNQSDLNQDPRFFIRMLTFRNEVVCTKFLPQVLGARLRREETSGQPKSEVAIYGCFSGAFHSSSHLFLRTSFLSVCCDEEEPVYPPGGPQKIYKFVQSTGGRW